MFERLFLLTLLIAVSGPGAPLASSATEGMGCVSCHGDKTVGFSAGHRFGPGRCTVCHQGDPDTSDKAAAHRALVAFPGNLSNARAVCGGCHAEKVTNVTHGLMHTGRGMVRVTRRVFGEPTTGADTLSVLGESPADSLLRKLCASCHLGQEKDGHQLDPVRDRGGGCLACHVNAYPEHGHPALSARVSDQRCFGCHSRSARIALGYAGLAEVEKGELAGEDPGALFRLQDGRVVVKEADDRHHRAGMGCIDCHTARGLMGWVREADYQEQAVDIACRDCHDNRGPRLGLDDWPADLKGRLHALPFELAPDQQFLSTGHLGTPLWNVEVVEDRQGGPEILYLHPKNGGVRLQIPQYSPGSHPLAEGHRRLTCEACHSQWAPQCNGCHLEYSRTDPQWDHLQRQVTPGRWHQKRWDVRRGLPTLGVTSENRVSPFIPGMILTLAHPDWDQARFRRFFAATSPHTVGGSRTCASCHRSPLALGLGQGRLTRSAGAWSFEPAAESAADGLPADAWTSLKGEELGVGTRPGERSFTREELDRILNVPVLGADRDR